MCKPHICNFLRTFNNILSSLTSRGSYPGHFEIWTKTCWMVCYSTSKAFEDYQWTVWFIIETAPGYFSPTTATNIGQEENPVRIYTLCLSSIVVIFFTIIQYMYDNNLADKCTFFKQWNKIALLVGILNMMAACFVIR